MTALLGITLSLFLQQITVQPPAFTYHIELQKAGDRRVSITIETKGLPFPQHLVMPRAIPMGYGEQPYDRFISALYAEDDDNRPVLVSRQEGPRWRISGESKLKRIRYTVDLGRMEKEILSAADSSKARDYYVGILGYSVFAFLEGHDHEDIDLRIRGPDGWKLFTTLAPRLPAPQGATRAYAPNFYALADSQIAMGPALQIHRVDENQVRRGRVPLYVAVYAEGPVDRRLIGRLGRKALDSMRSYFGTTPFRHYSMHLEFLRPLDDDHRYGFSMEHLDSSTYYLRYDQALNEDSGPDELRRAEFNYAHHIAHSWLPKRCSGEGYFPFSWELAPVLDSIWFSEGFAQYAAMDAIAGANEGSEMRLSRMVEDRFKSALDAQPITLNKLSTVELSRLASTRYSEDFRTGRGIYSRGGMMAAEMDMEIRKQSRGKKGLRDALRHLYRWTSRTGRAFSVQQLPYILEAGCDVDLHEIYERWMGPRVR